MGFMEAMQGPIGVAFMTMCTVLLVRESSPLLLVVKISHGMTCASCAGCAAVPLSVRSVIQPLRTINYPRALVRCPSRSGIVFLHVSCLTVGHAVTFVSDGVFLF